MTSSVAAPQIKNSHRYMIFVILLICGVITILIYTLLETDKTVEVLIHAGLATFFLVGALVLRSKPHLAKYWQAFFAFFIFCLLPLSWGVILRWTATQFGWSSATIDGFVYSQFVRALLIVIPIIFLTKISGGDRGSIFLKKGNLKSGLRTGIPVFIILWIISIPAAENMFGGNNLTWERIIPWLPWVLAAMFINAFEEELWFRAIFLKKFVPLIGVRLSILITSLVYALAHIEPEYSSILFIFLGMTFILGWWLGEVMYKTDSIIGPILIHAAFDIPIILAWFSNF